ncbi:MAG: chemotaxis protein CheW [Anaerolineae bacterium]|nr:chemotaxis protein CheW [Anaerolineae bacterium]
MVHDNNGRGGARLLQFKVPGLPDVAMAVTLQEVLEVTDLSAVARVPFAPPFLTGVVEWRGRVVTVVDMADLLCKDALQRPYRAAGAYYLVAKVPVGDRLDALAWSIVSGASMLSAPSQAPQADLPHEFLPQGIYAAVTLSETPVALLNLTGIVAHLKSAAG